MNSTSQSAPGYLGLASTPPLAILASIAAFIEVFIHRLALVSSFETFGAFFRNLTVITASIACLFGILPFCRRLSRIPISGRVSLALLAFTVMPTAIVFVFYPEAKLRPDYVFTLGAFAYTLSSFLALVGIRRSVGGVFVVLSILLFIANVLAMAVMTLRAMWQMHSMPLNDRVLSLLFSASELLYLLVLVFGAVAIFMQRKPASRRFFFLFAFQFVATAAAFVLLWTQLPTHAFGIRFYDAFGLELFLTSVPWTYLLPICGALSIATAGFYTLAPPMRQFSLGIALLVAAGFAPSTPTKFMVWVLALTLISRSIAARSFRAQ